MIEYLFTLFISIKIPISIFYTQFFTSPYYLDIIYNPSFYIFPSHIYSTCRKYRLGIIYRPPHNSCPTLRPVQAFKRRYCHLNRQADATYVLELFKDERRQDVKGTIFLDSALNCNTVGATRSLTRHLILVYVLGTSYFV